MAAKGESLPLRKCGNPINVQELREQSRDKAEEYPKRPWTWSMNWARWIPCSSRSRLARDS